MRRHRAMGSANPTHNFPDFLEDMIEQRSKCGHSWIRVAGRDTHPFGSGPCPTCKRNKEMRRRDKGDTLKQAKVDEKSRQETDFSFSANKRKANKKKGG
jgi:hypothetical protein